MKRTLMLLPLLLLFPAVLSAQQISSTNYTTAEANSSITAAYSYVNTVNESGYLIFQPNLTESYKYLSIAVQVYNSSPNTGVYYAQKAEELAQAQYGSLNYFRYRALPYVVLATAVVVFLLAKVMKPLKKKGRTSRIG